jgi:cytochrome c peroxidase
MKSVVAVIGSLVALAGCSHEVSSCPFDSLVDMDTCSTLQAMQLPSAFVGDKTNAVVQSEDAATLGYQIFFAKNLSGQSPMGCATCHSPEQDFTERTPTAVGIGTGTRNAPTLLDAAWMQTIFWDGRVDVVWAQPILAFENPLELNFTRLELAHGIAQYYASAYQAVFGPLPPLSDTTRFPPVGKPGDAAFDGMSPADQEAVNRIAADVGKSIEAYLRKLAAQQSPFDEFLAGNHDAITPHQELGALLFVGDGCANCHGGPQLTDQAFHNAGVSPLAGVAPDPGRSEGIVEENAQTFSAASIYSDDPQPAQSQTATPADLGAFRTPSLRNVALTGPYMHNGSFTTLDDAMVFHLSGGGSGFVGQVDPQLAARTIAEADRSAIEDFLSTLTGTYPPAPWNFWPNGP